MILIDSIDLIVILKKCNKKYFSTLIKYFIGNIYTAIINFSKNI